MDWNPFHDSIIATSSTDSTVKIWIVPESGPVSTDVSVQDLKGHNRKVGTAKWNPVAENIIATSGADFNVIVHDVRSGESKFTIGGHSGLISSCEWNYNGSLLSTACKDKKFRLIDPRAGTIVAEHDRSNIQGTKGNRCLWLGKRDFIISCGFGKTGTQRQYEVYDPRDLENPVLTPQKLDSGSGMLMPFYDMDTDLLFLAGKGDGNIRYYELDFDSGVVVNYVSEFTSNQPNAGMGFMPKRGCNVSLIEIAKMFKVTVESVQPLSFRVPRKQTSFAEDIFVPCSSDEPALNGDQWLSGENSVPRTMSLEQGYVEREKKVETSFVKKEDDGEPSGDELLRQWREQKKRIAFLEAEVSRLKK
jgi:coronin-1B/1C/6